MKKDLVALLLGILVLTAHAAQVDCASLARDAEQRGEIVPDAGSGRDITGQGRLQFYSAPDARCGIDGLFVVPGNTLFAQLEYQGFTKVAFIPRRKRDRQDVIAWVPSRRLRGNGQGVAPGRFTGER